MNTTKLVRLLPLLILITSPAISQKNNIYAILKASGVKYERTNLTAAVSLVGGVKVTPAFGMGVGAEVMKFKDAQSAYVPVFAEACFMPETKKAAPYCNLRVGYGIYKANYEYNSANTLVKTSVKGGLYLSPGVGIYLPFTRSGIILVASYVYSAFKAKNDVETAYRKSPPASNGGAIGLGVKF